MDGGYQQGETSGFYSTRKELLEELSDRLGSSSRARWIVEHVMTGNQDLVSISGTDVKRCKELADRCMSGEPLQYVLGGWAFRSLDIVLDDRVLIPRPETEEVVETAIRELVDRKSGLQKPVIVDLGTGSGVIALSIATEMFTRFPKIEIWASDVSEDALAVAVENYERILSRESQPCAHVNFCCGSWFDALPLSIMGGIDLVVSNPPYVGESEWLELDLEVRAEPYTSLVACNGSDGTPGLSDIEVILDAAPKWMAKNASLVLEIASHQADAAKHVARRNGFSDVTVAKDLAGRDRILVARKFW